MTKSYANFFLGLYDAILTDVIGWYPSLRESLMLDKARLLSLVEARGLSFLTIDLPELGKHFERCLSNGAFTTPRLPGSRPKRRSGGPIPRLFEGMYLRVFNEFGALRNDVDPNSVRVLRQLFYTAKKAKLECEDERTWKQVSEFFDIDRGLRSATRDWCGDEFQEDGFDNLHLGESLAHSSSDPGSLFEREEEIDGISYSKCWGRLDSIQLVCDIVASQLGVFDPLTWRTKHGPGAVADLRGKVSKYTFPSWPRKLDLFFPLADFAFANYACWAEDVQCKDGHRGRFSLNEPPSRLLAVPKTQKGPRLIAAEPTCYQWTQQSVKDYLTERVRHTAIGRSVHFRDQSFNQNAALRASRTQSHWTIDLSSASDRMSCFVVERALRRNKTLLRAIHATRTRWISNSIDTHSPAFYKLKKVSTQGSAVTFPLQTIVFACVAIGALLYERGLRPSIRTIAQASKEVLIFGDDIIVPDDGGASTLGALSDLGFKVNHNKTFGTGKFRESCGCDAYDGVDVTPTYTSTYPEKSRLESLISSVAVRNNFYKVGYYNAAAYIRMTVMRSAAFLRLPEVTHGSGLFGWLSYDKPSFENLKYRWNEAMSRGEYRFHLLKTRERRLPDRHNSRLLQYFTEAPDPTVQWESGVRGKPQLLLKLGWEGIDGASAKADARLSHFVTY